MDVQMTSAPVAQSGTATTTAAGSKAASKGNGTTDSFSALLSDQTAQENAAMAEGQPSETELSMSMMLQMLQSLVMPIQTDVALESKMTSSDGTLPELLLEAMNSNPELADKLLQDPKVKKWFDNAEDLLAALSNTPNPLAAGNLAMWQQSTTNSMSLKAQNTLLILSTLSKQQPDNPILNFLNTELASAIQPLLPEILAGVGNAKKITNSDVSTSSIESNVPFTGAKEHTSPNGRISSNKYINNRDNDSSLNNNLSVNLQSLQPKQEKFAIKHIPLVVTELSNDISESTIRPLVDLPIETTTGTNTVVTIGDLQKTQQVTLTTDKTPVPVLTADNFTEEMTTHVLKNMKITMSEGFSEAKLSLFPKNLGHVDVKISMHDGQLFAQFAADTLAGKQMLESQLPQLRQALLTQGLQVEKLEVTQSQNMASNMFQEQRQPQSFNQSQRQPKNRSGELEVDAIEFKEDMEQIAQLRNQANGNSFDVIA
ncbi:flagellar hook-length control protein FliK [Paenibacillus qinlingensis]|uniref:flagellar hook-length control protein FliK n=1 Tax=Paenibacillus qinlingensis TaxID=1837343 RepID=UPI00156671AA|nr:flagellar hook-length control protein FliK [Paenibacillus qinlingensis]NQX57389.1 flagellar hook-length control protein FliK [Paenibacillus qinlingensis]